MRQPIAAQSTKKLWAGAKADREQKQQEETLLDCVGQRDAELAHHDTRQQGSGNGTQLEAAQRNLAQQMAETQHEKERYLGVGLE